MKKIENFLSQFNVECRPYQVRIINKTIDFIEDGVGSVLIESPTGSGKTVMGLAIIKYLQEKYGYSINWCAMRRNLLHQTEEENQNREFDIDINYVSMFDKEAPESDILVVDEGQHDATNSSANIHAKTNAKIIIALSATPYRADKASLFFEKVIRDANVRLLIRDGFLSKFDHFTLESWTPEYVASVYLKDKKKWGKSIVFFHKEEDCHKFVEILESHQISVDLVTGKTNKESKLEKFVNGETDVLVNMMILTEGFNCPSIQTVFCRPSNKGVTVQMAGRALRLYKNRVKNIVQSKDTKYPFLKMAKAENEYLLQGDTWTVLERNPNIDQLAKQCLKLITTKIKRKTIINK